MATEKSRRPTIHNPTEVWRRRILAGLGQGELARRARISWPYLSLIESGKRSPGVKVLHRIAIELDCLVEELLAPHVLSSQAGDQAE